MMTYQQLWGRLTPLYDASEARAVVRQVLEEAFHLSLADVLCDGLSRLTDAQCQDLQTMMKRLESGEPVQYVLGHADFCGHRFSVTPAVLIPRPETQELCQWVAAARNVLDVGTGSGCIACTLAAQMPEAAVTAWDVSADALAVAAGNARRLGVTVTFRQQDALCPPPDESQWDAIVSNPPYVCCEERAQMERNVLDFEPALALFVPDEEPLRFYRAIARYAITALKPGGWLYFEINPRFATQLASLLTDIGFRQVEPRNDQFGKTRFMKACR